MGPILSCTKETEAIDRKCLIAKYGSHSEKERLHWKKKCSHFDLKSWVTGGTKIWPGISSNWRIFESNWLASDSTF